MEQDRKSLDAVEINTCKTNKTYKDLIYWLTDLIDLTDDPPNDNRLTDFDKILEDLRRIHKI